MAADLIAISLSDTDVTAAENQDKARHYSFGQSDFESETTIFKAGKKVSQP